MVESSLAGTRQTVRVLLVERDDDAAARIWGLLAAARHTDFRLERSGDVQAGLERLRRDAVDVLLVAAGLPDGGGLELVRLAQAGACPPPAILLADAPPPELDLEAQALGVADLLETRSLEAHRLERSIRYALVRWHQAEHLAHIAQHDQLTGLANRSLFQDRLGRALAWARRHERLVAVMVLDLNGFKAVNDRLGHGQGDRLLAIVARRITERLRETDTVARFGGDEFALIVENLAKPEHAALVARKVLDAIAPPMLLEGGEARVTASLGVALHPRDGEAGGDLLRAADGAMYRAKAEGGNLCRFSSETLERRVQRGAILESDLRRALAGDELCLHYQPQVSLAADVLGISARPRWQHPELGLIGAERFLPLAEDCGLLEPLCAWMLAAGCAQLRAWQSLAPPRFHLALPLLSNRPLAWSDLPGRLAHHLEAAGVAAGHLEIEIGEELLLADLEAGGTGLRALKGSGVRIALDGFGRGPTSLKGLKAGVLDSLKLAREILDGVPERTEATALVGAIVELCRGLGLRLVAEGVDDPRLLGFLRARGCSAVQAFMSCPPLPAEACTGWLRQAAGRQEDGAAAAGPPLALRTGS